MQDADRGAAAGLNGQALRIAIVRARFNPALTERLAVACVGELRTLGVAAANIVQVDVPGALELGVVLAALAKQGRHDALVAIGCVIRGETYHFELVANESGAAITRVSLEHGIAIANAILTCENEDQAAARAEVKGRDAARVAVEMASLLADLRG